MSTNQGSAREYVESYINDYKNEQEYLLKEQPRYDPTKPIPEAPVKKEEQQPREQQEPASTSFNIHAPTMNPIPSIETNEQVPQIAQTSSREQRNELHNTALTVCADLHENLTTCFQYGSWWDKAKMCEEQKQKFWACYNAQKRFLKDVGYKGPVNTEKEDARILVAAYNLRDKMDEKAKETEKATGN